jgi:hypothetical protein
MPGNKRLSLKLCEYIGRVEAEAFQAGDSFSRYTRLCDAPKDLPHLSQEETELAREYFAARARETRPDNIGGASGEAGEAD